MQVPAASSKTAAAKIEECAQCGMIRKGYTPDPCIGKYIPGVAHACCGHGDVSQAYVVGWQGCEPDEICVGSDGHWHDGFWEVRGQEALNYLTRRANEINCS